MEPSTEDKILAAAEIVFMRDGYDGARMKNIADEAGMNKALLHYYFRSKENLFQTVLQTKLNAFLPKILIAVDQSLSVSAKFEIIVDGYLKMLSKNPKLPIFIIFSVYRNPAFLKNMPGGAFSKLLTFFKREIRRGNLEKVDPEQLLLTIMSMCIFPYVAQPIAMHMLGKGDHEYKRLLTKRKKEILKILNKLIIVDQ